jgi:hypothetical protein
MHNDKHVVWAAFIGKDFVYRFGEIARPSSCLNLWGVHLVTLVQGEFVALSNARSTMGVVSASNKRSGVKVKNPSQLVRARFRENRG